MLESYIFIMMSDYRVLFYLFQNLKITELDEINKNQLVKAPLLIKIELPCDPATLHSKENGNTNSKRYMHP